MARRAKSAAPLRRLAFLFAALLGAGAAQAEKVAPPGFGAIGRLDFGDLAFCTGVLIAPDLVLTAAHCLFDPEGSAFDASEIRFLAGARQGRALASRWVEQVALHPNYDAARAEDLRSRAADLALLLLDAPILDPRAAPLALDAPPRPGERVSVISYAFDRPETPALEKSCVMLEESAALLVLTCDVDFGASGAPVLLRRDGKYGLVSMIAAKAESEGRKVALGLPLAAPLAELLLQIDPAKWPDSQAPELPSRAPN